METKSFSIILYGRVQQVGFRYFVFKLAAELGVVGFVKNQPDGSVYVEAEGESHIIEVFIAHCKMGPPQAEVTRTIVVSIPLQDFNEFAIR